MEPAKMAGVCGTAGEAERFYSAPQSAGLLADMSRDIAGAGVV